SAARASWRPNPRRPRRETLSAPATPGARYAPTAALRHAPADHHDRRPARPQDAATLHRSCSAPPSMPPPPTARHKAGDTDLIILDGTDICTLGLQELIAHGPSPAKPIE